MHTITFLAMHRQYCDCTDKHYISIYPSQWVFIHVQVTKTIDKLESMIDQTISDLLDELFMDLEGAFAKVLTRNWIDSSESINTICVTVEDYTQASEYRNEWMNELNE